MSSHIDLQRMHHYTDSKGKQNHFVKNNFTIFIRGQEWEIEMTKMSRNSPDFSKESYSNQLPYFCALNTHFPPKTAYPRCTACLMRSIMDEVEGQRCVVYSNGGGHKSMGQQFTEHQHLYRVSKQHMTITAMGID